MPCDALYIHVPFCERKCPYCDFYSTAADDAAMDAYTRALIRALDGVPFETGQLDTVYFGGGTPSILGGRRLAILLETVRARFGIAQNAEITAECNPHSTLKDTLRQMKSAGFNRISLGMQSAVDAQLRSLGRLHTVGDVVSAVHSAQDCGFEHLSLDLMLATPGQAPADIDEAVRLFDRLGVEHVSAYLLKIEEGTPFARQNVEESCPDEDGQVLLYRHAVTALEQAGYRQYEISNFARGGRVARHNLKYWDCAEYLGIGPSAHSFIAGRRRFFPRDLAGFLSAGDPWALLCDDGAGGSPEEYLMLRLRLKEGIRWPDFTSRYPDFKINELRGKAAPLRKVGLLELDDTGLRLFAFQRRHFGVDLMICPVERGMTDGRPHNPAL